MKTKNLIQSLAVAGLLFTQVAGANDAQQDTSAKDISLIESFSILPAIQSIQVSPNGKKLVMQRATSKDGDYIIEVHDTAKLGQNPVRLGADKMRVSGVSWLNDDKILVVFRQLLEDSGKKYWVNKFAITDADGKGDWLQPFKKSGNVSFSIIDILPDHEDEVLVEVDVNDNWIPDVVKLNIKTGRERMILRGSTKVNNGFIADKDGEIRVASGWNQNNQSVDAFAREKGSDEWKTIYSNTGEDRETFVIKAVSNDDPNKLYVIANNGEDKTGAYLYDIKTGKFSDRLFGLKTVDTDNIIFDKHGDIRGYTYSGKYPEYYITDPEYLAVYEGVKQAFPGSFLSLSSTSDDYNTIAFMTQSGTDPGTYYLLKDKKSIIKIGERMPFIDKTKLADSKYISYKARDGRKIRAYLTVPEGEGPFPSIVLPHGGPWVRDVITFDEWTQLLVSHGYAVIQPNYRGSTGYGLEHWKAGDKNWGLKMQDDLDDAAQYMIDKGITSKDKVAMFGWSYGGYAAFAASMRENNMYQCTVAGAGVSDLSRINARLHDNALLNKLQRPTIKGVSPVEQVEKVNVPILVIHGDIDGRVPIEHSDAFVSELKKHNKQHKYVVLEDADHFMNTLFYGHKQKFYSELIDWLDNTCGLK
ncbi:prolyl oligopeptidase family serine peptidase [Pseudoalteromonas sp. YIC-656]|uniref:alpha/beta hydrolase family protein n=1 Tax=Pseudoalteromonas pernae TaxID=3118054 RepID=UPI003241D0EF